jgi:hypothetical protein
MYIKTPIYLSTTSCHPQGVQHKGIQEHDINLHVQNITNLKPKIYKSHNHSSQ